MRGMVSTQPAHESTDPANDIQEPANGIGAVRQCRIGRSGRIGALIGRTSQAVPPGMSPALLVAGICPLTWPATAVVPRSHEPG